jgi:hypothetical protein
MLPSPLEHESLNMTDYNLIGQAKPGHTQNVRQFGRNATCTIVASLPTRMGTGWLIEQRLSLPLQYRDFNLIGQMLHFFEELNREKCTGRSAAHNHYFGAIREVQSLICIVDVGHGCRPAEFFNVKIPPPVRGT